MTEVFDGERTANQRIAEEAARQTGFLDLGELCLTVLPAELFRLRHLRVLNLGAGIRWKDGSWHEAHLSWTRSAPHNQMSTGLEDLRQLPALRVLSVHGTTSPT
jgi:hypothetical protein